MWGIETPAPFPLPGLAAGCLPKGRGPGARGPAGAGPRAGGAEESPGRKAEPRWDGPTRRGREAASRGPPLLRATATGAPALSPLPRAPPSNNGDGAEGVTLLREGEAERFGTRVRGGGRGGNRAVPFLFSSCLLPWGSPRGP